MVPDVKGERKRKIRNKNIGKAATEKFISWWA